MARFPGTQPGGSVWWQQMEPHPPLGQAAHRFIMPSESSLTHWTSSYLELTVGQVQGLILGTQKRARPGSHPRAQVCAGCLSKLQSAVTTSTTHQPCLFLGLTPEMPIQKLREGWSLDTCSLNKGDLVGETNTNRCGTYKTLQRVRERYQEQPQEGEGAGSTLGHGQTKLWRGCGRLMGQHSEGPSRIEPGQQGWSQQF